MAWRWLSYSRDDHGIRVLYLPHSWMLGAAVIPGLRGSHTQSVIRRVGPFHLELVQELS